MTKKLYKFFNRLTNIKKKMTSIEKVRLKILGKCYFGEMSILVWVCLSIWFLVRWVLCITIAYNGIVDISCDIFFRFLYNVRFGKFCELFLKHLLLVFTVRSLVYGVPGWPWQLLKVEPLLVFFFIFVFFSISLDIFVVLLYMNYICIVLILFNESFPGKEKWLETCQSKQSLSVQFVKSSHLPNATNWVTC